MSDNTPNVQRALDEFYRLTDEERRQYYNGLLIPSDNETAKNTGAAALSTRRMWTAAELAKADFPEPKWAVPGILPVGLSILGGRPKLGKSWLSLQIAGAVATGGRVFDIRVSKGKVLYMALEDSPRRIKDRMNKQGIPSTADIDFYFTWMLLTDGGLVDLQNAIEREKYSLIVIDTLSRAVGGRVDQKDEGDMTTVIGSLQYMAMDADISLLMNDHHTKPRGFDSNPIDDILGSTAKAAVLDCALGLYREQGKREATLKIVGRDIEEQDYALKFDGLTGCWQNLGEADGVRKDSNEAAVLAAIGALKTAGAPTTNKKIADYTKLDESYTYRLLSQLITAGKVRQGERVGRGVPYELV